MDTIEQLVEDDVLVEPYEWQGEPRLRLTAPGYVSFAPKLPGWEPFFVARFGHERTTFSYAPLAPTSR